MLWFDFLQLTSGGTVSREQYLGDYRAVAQAVPNRTAFLFSEHKKGETKMEKEKYAPIDALLKEHSLGAAGNAWLANTPMARHDKQAQRLVKRWKTVHGKYAELSKHYSALTVRMASLAFPNPQQIWDRYEELDKKFDALAPAMKAVHNDLKKWVETSVQVETVTKEEMERELNTAGKRCPECGGTPESGHMEYPRRCSRPIELSA
jgi:hypothetical protein